MAAAEEQVHVIQGDVEDHYEMLEDYGSGQYARVYKAEHKETGKIVAVKLIDKADTGVNVSDDKEINVMLRIDHPYLSLIHISEPTRLLSISYAVFCLKKKKKTHLNNKSFIHM
eukprot:TRINITY_DN12746_c0_g1_i3.p1 TRINITY_DN12746_c0_g1~~TRINITY_DN12746_c0_g1_i3.p1  ORF type:complete len:114 (-),score=46.86 TRINITY_DN12746_c0_g1_i3:62-403(-)